MHSDLKISKQIICASLAMIILSAGLLVVTFHGRAFSDLTRLSHVQEFGKVPGLCYQIGLGTAGVVGGLYGLAGLYEGIQKTRRIAPQHNYLRDAISEGYAAADEELDETREIKQKLKNIPKADELTETPG